MILKNKKQTTELSKDTNLSKQEKRRQRRSLRTLIIFALGWYIMMFPTAANLFNKAYNLNKILAYNDTMVSYSNEDVETIMNKCLEYNQTIYEEQQKSTFKYRGGTATDMVYDSLPTSSDEIGVLDIPSLDVTVSVRHGTSDSELNSTAGHLYGTSLPVDGENVHAVIAAHSALSTAKLFTDLNKMKKGDSFFITVLNTKYEYKVVDINVMLPEDEWKYEQIEEGKNYVTLYTCTPYGVNTHRLLVKGELVGSETVDRNGEFRQEYIWEIVKNAALFALIIITPGLVAILDSQYLKKKRTKKKGERNDNPKKDKEDKQSITSQSEKI